MKSIILAGGAGLRLRKIIKNIPKPMVPIAGKPFLEYLILQLIKFDIRDIILSIGYKGEIIKSYFGSGKRWGAHITYSEEAEPLGTGGAIKKAAAFIENEQFIAMNGDSFLDLDFTVFIAYHNAKQAIATLAAVYVDDITRYGRVEINETGEVTGFIEKNSTGEGFINGGVYILNQIIINNMPSCAFSIEKDVLPALSKKGLYGMSMKCFFSDIGMPQDYLVLNENPRILFDSLKL